jgi:hypothetical protein
MATTSSDLLDALIREREQLVFEMDARRNKIAGLDIAIKLASEGEVGHSLSRHQKVHVSHTILSILAETGETGTKPKMLVELAASRGIVLNRASVYSLLNRMERAGTVVHEDARYKLREFAQEQAAHNVRSVARGAGTFA